MNHPENEIGVVVLFAQQCQQKGLEIVSIQETFPDAKIRDMQGEMCIVEFEYVASNFYKHGHDPRDCDLIICWVDDCPDSILPVVELENSAWTLPSRTSWPTMDEKAVDYWKGRALKAETKVKQLKASRKAVQATVEYYQCECCERVFETQQALNAHSRIHKGNGHEQLEKAKEAS